MVQLSFRFLAAFVAILAGMSGNLPVAGLRRMHPSEVEKPGPLVGPTVKIVDADYRTYFKKRGDLISKLNLKI